MRLEVRELWHETRERCKTDLFFLGQEILGYDYRNPPRFLRDMRDAIHDKVDFLALGPRGHSKTTTNDVVGTVFEILRDPNIRILLAHGVLDKAQLILKQATDQFRKNEKLRTLFPEHAPEGRDEDPTLTRFTTPARTRIFTEPTVMAGAPGSSVTGMHYDLIKATDLVNEQNVPAPIGLGTVEAMQKVTEFVKTLTPLLDSTNPDSRRQLDGTRWFDEDAYGYIIDNYKHFRIISEGIKSDDAGDPIPIWDLVTKQKLVAAKAEAGNWLWAANYCQDPLPAETAMFKRSWFHTYEKEPHDEDGNSLLHDVMLIVDLAYSESKAANRTAMVVSGVDSSGALYVMHASAGTWRGYEVVERIYSLYQTYAPELVGMESNSCQRLMQDVVWTEFGRRGTLVPLYPLHPMGANKTFRALGMSNFAERYGIYVKAEHDELVDEMCRFPAATADDYVDCMSYRGQFLGVPDDVITTPAETPRLRAYPTRRMTGEEVLRLCDAQHSATEWSVLG